jgi:hypothetical protein
VPGSPAQISVTQAIMPIEVNPPRSPSRFDADDGMKRVWSMVVT